MYGTAGARWSGQNGEGGVGGRTAGDDGLRAEEQRLAEAAVVADGVARRPAAARLRKKGAEWASAAAYGPWAGRGGRTGRGV